MSEFDISKDSNAERYQKACIILGIETSWTPQECNDHGTWEEVRDQMMLEHLEEQGYEFHLEGNPR